jgi:hypothetical protein
MAGSPPQDGEDPRLRLETSVAHSARVWNYLLGGKNNSAVGRVDCTAAGRPSPGRRSVVGGYRRTRLPW